MNRATSTFPRFVKIVRILPRACDKYKIFRKQKNDEINRKYISVQKRRQRTKNIKKDVQSQQQQKEVFVPKLEFNGNAVSQRFNRSATARLLHSHKKLSYSNSIKQLKEIQLFIDQYSKTRTKKFNGNTPVDINRYRVNPLSARNRQDNPSLVTRNIFKKGRLEPYRSKRKLISHSHTKTILNKTPQKFRGTQTYSIKPSLEFSSSIKAQTQSFYPAQSQQEQFDLVQNIIMKRAQQKNHRFHQIMRNSIEQQKYFNEKDRDLQQLLNQKDVAIPQFTGYDTKIKNYSYRDPLKFKIRRRDTLFPQKEGFQFDREKEYNEMQLKEPLSSKRVRAMSKLHNWEKPTLKKDIERLFQQNKLQVLPI